MLGLNATSRLAVSWAVVFLALLAFAARVPPADAADTTFVGVLAYAIEDDVAKQLNLSDEVRGKLVTLVEARERAALALVAKIRDLSPAEAA